MTVGIRTVRAGAVTLALLSAVLVVGAPPAGAAEPHVIGPDPAAIDGMESLAVSAPGTARCGAAAADPVPDGEPIVVKLAPARAFTVGAIPASSWRKPPVADPSWQLQYQGLMWVRPLARRAAEDNQRRSLAALVAQVVAFHRQNPDPSRSAYGWDEATASRRLQVENCLYALTGSASLRPGMIADAAVLLGKRYYGPPLYRVHNHGLMSNMQLIRAADLLGKPSWRSTAIARMTREGPLAFSKRGTTNEQSSMYHRVNMGLWTAAVEELKQSPSTQSAAARIGKLVAAAHTAYQWMTEPDGKIVQIGDADLELGEIGPLRTPRVLRDDEAGWIIGRWSWTDPKTTYYTVRYGPRRIGHGHQDRAGGVTFSTAGVRVLVGPGRYTYDASSSYYRYQIGPQGQNVAIPDKGKARDAAVGKVAAAAVQAPAHAWTIKDSMFGIRHTRTVRVVRDTRSMQVGDSFSAAKNWRQYWHLDPAWTWVSGRAGGRSMAFSHPSGRRLTVTTTGSIDSVARGVTRVPAGWHFPGWRQRVRANEIVIRNRGKACTTTFRVS